MTRRSLGCTDHSRPPAGQGDSVARALDRRCHPGPWRGGGMTPVIERSETGGGDPDGSAGGAGGKAPRGIERSETGGGDPDGSAGGAGGKAPRGIDRAAMAARVRAGGPRAWAGDAKYAGGHDELEPGAHAAHD